MNRALHEGIIAQIEISDLWLQIEHNAAMTCTFIGLSMSFRFSAVYSVTLSQEKNLITANCFFPSFHQQIFWLFCDRFSNCLAIDFPIDLWQIFRLFCDTAFPVKIWSSAPLPHIQFYIPRLSLITNKPSLLLVTDGFITKLFPSSREGVAENRAVGL